MGVGSRDSGVRTNLKISFPPELPISAHVGELAELIREHPVVVVAGETGSGKTTSAAAPLSPTCVSVCVSAPLFIEASKSSIE